MPKFMIEALSQYRMTYVIEADTKEQALEFMDQNEYLDELGQKWLGEIILSSREVTDEETIRVFDEMNDYLVSWTPDRKLELYHKAKTSEN